MPLPHAAAATCSRRARLTNCPNLLNHASNKRTYTRPSFAPKPTLDLKHIRQNPGLYEQNALDRNYAAPARNGWRILELHQNLLAEQTKAVEFRQRGNVLSKLLGAKDADARSKEEARKEAKGLKESLAAIARLEKETQGEMERLAMELPNLSSLSTPVGEEARVVGWVNGEEKPEEKVGGKSHVDIGKELDLLDFTASATTSGWGWYFLKNEGALLEQALIQYALSVAMKRGWKVMTPPSLVYSHIASACGFMPRDQNGETQIYNIAQPDGDGDDNKPSLVLAGTAEIPFAGSQANKTLAESDLPLKVIGPSRCYRAEAGARGVDTKGLYRVHEFTKVEMFAWTKSPPTAESSDRFGTEEDDETAYAPSQSEAIFNEMLSIQTEILTSLGLHARILEMPSTDLGASATRKIDIEAFFPSRTGIDEGYGEVTSASICTDYQSRRLGTRFRGVGEGSLRWPHTVNGTAMAVPRILAAVLENGWVEGEKAVVVPEVLRRWMPDGMERITCARE
jgi:seryl-tRNA synthetase